MTHLDGKQVAGRAARKTPPVGEISTYIRMQLAGNHNYSNNLRSHGTDKGSKVSASSQKSPSNPDRHETADRLETVGLGSRFPSNGTAYIYVVLIYAERKKMPWWLSIDQGTTKAPINLGGALGQGLGPPRHHQGITKAWPKSKTLAQAWGSCSVLVADNKAGYSGVCLSNPGYPKPFQVQVTRGGKTVSMGSFATAEEASLHVARSPEGRAAAQRAAAAPVLLTSEEALCSRRKRRG